MCNKVVIMVLVTETPFLRKTIRPAIVFLLYELTRFKLIIKTAVDVQ